MTVSDLILFLSRKNPDDEVILNITGLTSNVEELHEVHSFTKTFIQLTGQKVELESLDPEPKFLQLVK